MSPQHVVIFQVTSKEDKYILVNYAPTNSTIFNNIAKAKFQVASGPGSHWLIDSPATRPPDICVNLVLKHIHAASI